MNLARIIDQHPADDLALVDGAEEVTYGQLRERVDAMRTLLANRSVKPGDHVVLACGNEIHFVVAMLGVFGVGAVAAPLNPYSPIKELVRKAEPMEPTLVVVGDVASWMLERPDDVGMPMLDMSQIVDAGEAPPAVVSCEPSDPAVLLSTSGVSGVPKIAVLSHGNLAWVQEALTNCGDQSLQRDDVSLATLPVAHVLGLNVAVLATLRVGGKVVLQRRFDVDESLRLISEHQVTMLTGAPPMWQRWAESDAPADSMASVRFARSGAAALQGPVFEAMRERFGVEVREGYGLTETSSVVSTGRGLEVRQTSVGKPLPGLEVVLVDDDGEPVDFGDVGEIVVRGPGVFQGYLNDPDGTASILTEDGWLWTGDVGLFDDDGFLYLVDRVKDVIIVSGFNVYPAEVETALMAHPDVRGAVVVGTAHGKTGETVVAHISGAVDETELRQFAEEHLSRYKCPTEYHFVDELPVAPTGKPVRRELRS